MNRPTLLTAGLVAIALVALAACSSVPPDYAAQYRPIQDAFIAVWNGGKPGDLDEIVAPKFLRHGASEEAEDLAALKNTIKVYRSAFSDLHVTIDEAWYMKDRAFYHWTVTGTNNGAGLGGQAPTDKAMNVSGLSAMRYEGGKIAEELIYYDQLDLYQQLGYILTPPS